MSVGGFLTKNSVDSVFVSVAHLLFSGADRILMGERREPLIAIVNWLQVKLMLQLISGEVDVLHYGSKICPYSFNYSVVLVYRFGINFMAATIKDVKVSVNFIMDYGRNVGITNGSFLLMRSITQESFNPNS